MAGETKTCSDEDITKVLEQMPDGVMILDGDAVILFANKTGARLVKMKPKKVLGASFVHAVEDGPMRDFDVELTVKEISWAGNPARLLHLKSMKNSGAFHLEWKLESALERAREAEAALAELRAQPESPADSESPTGSPEVVARLEERVAELETLLDLAEEKADKLLDDIHLDDHQQATALQDALRQAQDAEQQVRQMEEDLQETRDRVRVAEEQAEVAEERAYSLEIELEQALADAEAGGEEPGDHGEQEGDDSERVSELESQISSLQDQVSSLASDLIEQKARNTTLEQNLDQAVMDAEEARSNPEMDELREQVSELDELRAKVSELEGQLSESGESEEDHGASELQKEIDGLQAELAQREERITELEDELTAAKESMEEGDEENARVTELESTLEEKNSELEAVQKELEEKAGQLEDKSAEAAEQAEKLESLSSEIQEKNDDLDLAREESEELAEQLRSEQEQFQAERDEFESERNRIQGERDEIETERDELTKKLDELQSDLDAAAGERDSLLVELEEAARATEEQSTEATELAEKVATLEEVTDEVESLKKKIRRLETQLEDAEELAQKGEKVDKLERKLEGALRRAEEAEERLGEERRLLQEAKDQVEKLSQAGPAVGGEASGDETERLAFQDVQTGLPNRNIIQRYLDFMLKQSAGNQQFTAMLRIDCDNFKTISDTFGVDVGDHVIRAVGERLSSVIEGSAVLGRYGEDEFIMLLPELDDQDQASVTTATIIKRIYQKLRQPVQLGDQSLVVGVSIGVSVYPVDAKNGEQMFEHSAVALKRAKESGRGQSQYFTPELQTAHVARNALDIELKNGLENGQFELLYQPIFDLVNGQIVGVESLVRWKHPVHGVLSPGDFLQVAEDSGIMVLIGHWVIRTALEATAQWHQRGLGFFVSINLSQRQLLQADLLPTIQAALTEFRCAPERLLLEIPERLSGQDYPKIRETLAELQRTGIRLAVDNFGTAASSLQDLRRGPYQVLKVDREFVRGVHQNDESKSIVMSALTMGHHLGRLAVAVGVETEQEKAWLAQMGCRFAQGNILSEPLMAAQISELTKRS